MGNQMTNKIRKKMLCAVCQNYYNFYPFITFDKTYVKLFPNFTSVPLS